MTSQYKANTLDELEALSVRVKLRLLEMHHTSHTGHIGGNLSCIDAMLVLHHLVMLPGDKFLLSKGHSAGALYSVLWSIGALTEEDLRSYYQDGTRLAGHPPAFGVPEIEFATGSLGHGPSLAAGQALALKLARRPGHVWCITSDGEWQEGSCWEALTFARHNALTNLTLLVDVNGLQGFGTTREVASFHDLEARFNGFGVHTASVDGHDHALLVKELSSHRGAGPGVILLNTVKGNGISFLENRLESHYLPLSEEQYLQALDELQGKA